MSTLELESGALRKVLQNFNESLGSYINEDQRYKLGRILTIIDASISDPEQRKAIKDLVQNEWWNDGMRAVESGTMSSPHIDLRAICKLFGFELYQQDNNAPKIEINERTKTIEEWSMNKYKKAALEEN